MLTDRKLEKDLMERFMKGFANHQKTKGRLKLSQEGKLKITKGSLMK
jgi:hypothetical protein